ncbi:two-component sensor histidine kinase [Lysobacteraceae bacterium NML91-0213]|nr:two-component sensor histidine kinase [Xanthomonadaceae bacterium NML91-0213]
MPILRPLLQPMVLAALVTWGAVVLGLRAEDPQQRPLMWLLAAIYMVAILAVDFAPRTLARQVQTLGLALQAICALALVGLAHRGGTAPVLLVVTVAQLAMLHPPRVTIPLVVLLDVGLYLLLRRAGYSEPLLVTVLYLGFQMFAALTAHYARTAEASRDALARVNADLLATRALLADSARDAERLRLARELHDVAGHKLTALNLNLRALAADPALHGRPDLAIAQRMGRELLGDIRGVVNAMRDSPGLDIATALQALAAPFPRPALRLEIADDLRIDDPALAEAVLRLVQEALTNAARHAGADTLVVRLMRNGASLQVSVEDDGHLRTPPREGNGLAGMRERIAAVGGRLTLGRGPGGSMRIDAELPL